MCDFIYHFIQAAKFIPRKGPQLAPAILIPSKLLLLHGEVKSYCFIVICVPESMFNYLVHSALLHFDMLQIKY